MKSLIIAAVAAAGVGIAAPAIAQAQTTSADPTLTSPKVYMNLGYTYLSPYNHDLGELTGRAGVQVGRYMGVEGEIGGGVIGNHFGPIPGVNNRVNLSEGIQTSIYGVGFLPITVMGNHRIELLARGGYGQTPLHWTSDANPHNLLIERSVTAVSWNYGAGVQYMVNGHDGLRFDYTRRDFQTKGFDNPHDTDTYSLSFVHRF